MKFQTTDTFGQTIDKYGKKSGAGTEPWVTPENKARGDDLAPSTSTTIERPFKNVDTIFLADP
jgi:hypothetical protein